MMITSHEGKQGDGSHKTIIGQPGSSAWKWMDPIPLGGCLALNWHACRESRVARVTTSTPEIVQAALSSLRPHSASDTLTLLLHFIKQIDQQPSPARRPTSTTTGTASRNRARLPLLPPHRPPTKRSTAQATAHLSTQRRQRLRGNHHRQEDRRRPQSR